MELITEWAQRRNAVSLTTDGMKLYNVNKERNECENTNTFKACGTVSNSLKQIPPEFQEKKD